MKKIILLLMLLPYFLGAMNILISDSNQSHAETCSTYVQTYCPTANITIRLESLSSSVTWAIDNDINIISRSLTGMSDSYQALGAQAYADSGLGIVMAHGANTHTEYGNPSYLGYIVTVGCGTSGINTGSYGYGLEWFVNGTAYESWATAISAGMIGQLMIDHSWTFNQARQALRQTASNWSTGWISDGGFGYVNYASADTLLTSELYKINCVYGINIVSNWDKYIQIDWTDYLSSSWDVSVASHSADFNSTVIANVYSMSHGVNATATFNIVPDSSRVESYSEITASVFSPIYAGATQDTLRPVADSYGTTNNWPPFAWHATPAAPNRYARIDEVVADTGDYITVPFMYGSEGLYFSHGTSNISGTITSVTFYAMILAPDSGDGYGGDFYFSVDIDGTRYTNTLQQADTPTLVSKEYIVSPATSEAWTPNEINSMLMGIVMEGGYDSGAAICYQLYVVVDYTPASTGTKWHHKICGTDNAEKINGVAVANVKSVNGVE